MKENMMSLYDYLGKPAGPSLGKLVAEYAKIKKTKIDSRQVNTKTYSGNVLLYTKEFLDEYFHKKHDFTELNIQLTEDYFNEDKIF